MSKKIGILFSGGLDSTYLMWKNLKDGNEVTPIYIEIQNNKNKTILEKNRIELLHNEFSKEFNSSSMFEKKKLNSITYLLSTSVQANENSLYFKQVPIWIFGLVFSQDLNIDEIQIGYVSNDDAISYLSDIKKIYKSYKSILNKQIPLKFPLRKFKKFDLAHELPKQYLDLIISCENPEIIGSTEIEKIEYEPCCECVPCKNIIASNYYETEKFPSNYMNNLRRFYTRRLIRFDCKVFDNDGNKIDYWGAILKDVEKKFEPYQLKIQFDE